MSSSRPSREAAGELIRQAQEAFVEAYTAIFDAGLTGELNIMREAADAIQSSPLPNLIPYRPLAGTPRTRAVLLQGAEESVEKARLLYSQANFDELEEQVAALQDKLEESRNAREDELDSEEESRFHIEAEAELLKAYVIFHEICMDRERDELAALAARIFLIARLPDVTNRPRLPAQARYGKIDFAIAAVCKACATYAYDGEGDRHDLVVHFGRRIRGLDTEEFNQAIRRAKDAIIARERAW